MQTIQDNAVMVAKSTDIVSMPIPVEDSDKPGKNHISTIRETLLMNGKLLVVGIVLFFLLFFVYESWMMRGLPH
ncbi:hypothetical protein OBA47_00395 [bacterium]|nr:hypothetical protein [bacterium]MDC3185680.1 hypothetical protein [bacterium]